MNDIPDIVLFFGRFHPLVVHLPIGFLFFAFILEVLANYQKKEALQAAGPLALFLGAISAITACILGYLLSLSGEYDVEALDRHFWFGIATTCFSILAWLLKTGKIKKIISESFKLNIASLTIVVILLSITGHYGGNLTHGSSYLTAYLPFGKKENKTLAKINTIEEASIFTHLVNPIFQKKCATCHNSEKKKGSFSLENERSILKGGKNGPAIIAGNSEKSELIKRVHLNPDDEDFMPPEGKTPLTEEEIKIIEYWIDNGHAGFETKVGDIETPEEMRILIAQNLGLIGDQSFEGKISLAPPISNEILERLRLKNVNVRELVAETNQLDISLLSVNNKKPSPEEITETLNELSKIKDNIVWLSLPNNGINNAHLKIIGTFTKLKRLGLEKNNISDEGIAHLTNLKQLESLNLHSNSKITDKSIDLLSNLKGLKNLYTWQTAIKKEKN